VLAEWKLAGMWLRANPSRSSCVRAGLVADDPHHLDLRSLLEHPVLQQLRHGAVELLVARPLRLDEEVVDLTARDRVEDLAGAVELAPAHEHGALRRRVQRPGRAEQLLGAVAVGVRGQDEGDRRPLVAQAGQLAERPGRAVRLDDAVVRAVALPQLRADDRPGLRTAAREQDDRCRLLRVDHGPASRRPAPAASPYAATAPA
jgi:hypothetical protein